MFNFETPFPGRNSVPPSFVSFFAFYIFSYLLSKTMGCFFWVPDVLCQHSEVVLWKLLNVQMIFWWICERESGLSILFLLHLRTAPRLHWFYLTFFKVFLNTTNSFRAGSHTDIGKALWSLTINCVLDYIVLNNAT